MTLRERARIATAARQRMADERAERLRVELERDSCLKRAAWEAGIPERTARRYLRERIAA